MLKKWAILEKILKNFFSINPTIHINFPSATLQSSNLFKEDVLVGEYPTIEGNLKKEIKVYTLDPKSHKTGENHQETNIFRMFRRILEPRRSIIKNKIEI